MSWMNRVRMIRKLNRNDRIIICKIRGLFRMVDKQAERFKKLTGLRCPKLCGLCCETTNIEATAVEMFPLALELWSGNETEMWLKKLEGAINPGLCVFFKPDSAVPGNGRCAVYGLRPFICRLFGFFTIKDKYGNDIYGSCKIIKEKYSLNYQKARKLIESKFHPLSKSDIMMRIVGISSSPARAMLPINQAAKTALEKIGFYLDYLQK